MALQAVADPCTACAGEAESRSMPDSEQEEENHTTFDTSRLHDQDLSIMHDTVVATVYRDNTKSKRFKDRDADARRRGRGKSNSRFGVYRN